MKAGDKVTYVPKREKGIIKSICPDPNFAFVVYSCGGDWEFYQNYTGVRTLVADLEKGWRKPNYIRL